VSVAVNNRNREFPTTRWTLVAAAGHPAQNTDAADAIASLYRSYWPAVYAYVRHRGHMREDAEDLVQSFFSHLLESRALGRADRLRGRFRSFLLVSLKNFLATDYQRRTALKRGGDPRLTLDSTIAEDWYASCAVDRDTPDRVYDRRWAMALLNRARRRLRQEFVDEDRRTLFDHLIPYLAHDERPPYPALSARLGQSEGALRVALHRFRRRFGELLRDEIRHTVSSPDQVRDELRHLLDAVGQSRSTLCG